MRTSHKRGPIYIGYGPMTVCRCGRLAPYLHKGRYFCVPCLERETGWRVGREVKR